MEDALAWLSLALVMAFVAGAGLAITGAVVGLAWLVISRLGAFRQQAPSEVGRAAGLEPRGPNDAWGERDGVRVHARWTSERRGSGKNSRTVRVMRYFAYLDPPLRMGLGIGREGLLDGVLDAIGLQGEIEVGDPELDRAIRIRAIEPAHAAAVLRDPEVKRALLRGVQHGAFGVDDHRAAAGHDRWARSPAELAGPLEVVHAIARATRDARARTRASWEARLDESWGALARTESWQWAPERSRLAARTDEAWATLEIEVDRGALRTRLALRLDAPLGIGLQISRTGMGDQIGALLGAQDVRCGHAAFDAAFTVKARDAESARHLLAGGGADAIVRLATIFPDLAVDDRGADASIGTLLVDPRTAGQAVRAAIELAGALAGRGGAGGDGAYR